MLFNFGLPKSFWVEITNITYFLVNQSHSFVIDKKNLEEVWSGTLANYSNLKIFGCLVFVHVDHEKLEQRFKQCLPLL